MNTPAPTPPAAAGPKLKGPPQPPAYRHFTEFADTWLLPMVNVRLAEANREGTYTWCSQWWRHRSVAVRIAHLHAAFEASRRSKSGSAISTYVLNHVDPHFTLILDAANGPLYRCTRTEHNTVPSLSADPVPANWFGTTPTPTPDAGTGSEEKPQPLFAHYSDFVTDWLLPVTAVRVTANNREGHYTWCRQWWRHHEVVLRFAAIHSVFEAARRAEDKTAMSSLFVSHIDRHMRRILDAAQGPLHLCTPHRHIELTGLPNTAIAPAWFGIDGTTTPIEHLGWGPDFRALAPASPAGPRP
ncbi:DUF4913 domain-containing protein [Nocardia sp. NPDC052278]|uniref:DUF4913 domain-containing protein n=1 Tax=unclassified Nocardia TaxID=2637762 RepID=UPI0036A50760